MLYLPKKHLKPEIHRLEQDRWGDQNFVIAILHCFRTFLIYIDKLPNFKWLVGLFGLGEIIYYAYLVVQSVWWNLLFDSLVTEKIKQTYWTSIFNLELSDSLPVIIIGTPLIWVNLFTYSDDKSASLLQLDT